MATRERKHELKVFLSDDEERILEGTMKLMKLVFVLPMVMSLVIANVLKIIRLSNTLKPRLK